MRVVGAWNESLDRLAEAGVESLETMSAPEVAVETRTHFGDTPADQLLPVGILATRALFDDSPITDTEAETAWSDTEDFRRSLRQSLPRTRRVVTLVDPRPLWSQRQAISEMAESNTACSSSSSV